MKKLILSSIFALSLASVGGFSSAYADHHECACDESCAEKCASGDHKDCTCKTCECSEGKECKHGKCSTHKHKKSGKKAAAVEKSGHSEEAHSH